jgi:general secretion pathway protein F
MPAFSYEAINIEGETRKGVMDAESARAARNILRSQNWIPLSVELVGQRNRSFADIELWRRKIFSSSALMIWTRQLASLVSAGLPLERALTSLVDEASTPKERDLVASLRAEVNAGNAFGSALGSHPNEFPELYIAVIASGEQTGRLGEVLERLANDLERAQSLKSKLLAASLYPAIVSLVALAIVIFLLSYVVPQVATVFVSSHHALPLLTVVMLGISKFVQDFGWVVLVMILILLSGLDYALKNTTFKERFDAAWLKLPLLGKLSLGYNSARFASTLALLSAAGVPILKSLETAAQTLSNASLKVHALEALVLVR